ncbi:inositol hexakisphosphate and diphosphoinositol-pentakisphosphate kinase 1 isoform X3 [Xiphophorus couchianus]|uniref:inositol hexakisphosphate and diphosphoinositol-pentakisphosphate kinase 1 isoform X3 n=1 Tax=Xiphophorus couchianus TaxID=32473 RepID=UPI001016346A|nr:inositol hexakisphosphate and diphosphoinositol-pentakisphosphate kinase 1 isoform X3 [Xiphophorus couchianus]
MSEPNSPGESQRGAPRFYVGCEDDESEVQEDSMRTDMDLYEDDEDTPPERQIVVGICCMMKKSKSKPMTQILERLCRFEYITVVIFPEDTILNEPVDKWPLCDCLISFHSKGFPLDNAVSYAKLRSPLFINDLNMQYYIQDRREVYRILQEEGIELPRYAVLNRDPAKPNECNLVEGEDHVEVNGEIFQKPFVEKPVCAEDHNVYIYYPTSAGGGSQRLFRKIGSRSSVYSPESSVRKTGSYIYEEFMPTDGTDVKVYTVGPDYAHAEARKSPALDGKVERDSEGKEVRYPVILSAMEKLVARKVCLAFKQTVCGFDLLRANGHSYVCDVNGFSFVKNSMKYYDDCAKILGNIVMRELAPQFQIPWSIPTEAEDIPIVPTTSGTMMELRSVIAVIRHGDRTPKQKMKMEVRNPMFFDLFEKYDGYKTGKLKLKKPKQLQEVLDITRQLLIDLGQRNDCEIEEKKSKLEQLKTVLEMYGHFSGINRKVQLTYLPHGQPKTSSEDEDTRKEGQSLLLVLKWGGELTPAGRVQAEELGRAFRCIYPGGQGDYAGFPGCGLLRLHSTYRHDLKIYASDEGRVQMTAASFAKGLLALEGELTPILVQMVKSANMNGLLDNDSDSLSSCQHRVKARLHEILQRDREFNDEDYDRLAPTCATSLLNSMKTVKNPVATCDEVYTLIQSLTSQIRTRMENPNSSNLQLYHSETLELMLQRWSKLEKDFRMKNGRYDISKIPDIYDCVKYDVIHNATLGLKDTQELFRLSRALADIVIPQEYGINRAEKLDIAYAYCLPLVRKIQLDLQRTHGDEFVNKLHPLYSRGVLSPGRHVRTRLYFTSESHVHSLLSIFRYGSLLDEEKDQQWKRAMDYLNEVAELNYMTQIVIMLYEDNNKDISSEERFHVELHFSPGVKGVDEDEHVPHGFGFRPASSEVTRQNGQKKEERSSLEDLTRDETDRAVPASEPITIQKRSPLIRNHKTGSMEVLSETSSSKVGNYRLFSISRQSPEMKQSGLGSQCAGLFSTTVLGGSSSAPNLQDYARAHRKKYSTTSLSYKDEQIRRDEARRIERGRKQGAAIEQKRRDQVRRIDRGKKLDSVSELSKREAAKKREKDKKEELVELSKREVAKKSEKREKRWKSETDKTEESEYSGKEEAKKREKRERDKKEESELGKREVVKKRERSKTEESEQSGKEESKKSEKREKREKREKSEEEKKEGSELSKRDVAKKSEKHEKSETDKAEEPEQSGKEETKKSEKTKEPVQLGKREVAKKSEKRQKIEEDKKEEPEQSGKEEAKKSEKRERDKTEEPVELSKRDVAKKSEKHEKSETDKAEEPVEQSGKEETKKSEKIEEDKKEEPELSKRDVAKKSEKHEKSETDKTEEPELSKRDVAKKSEKHEKSETDKAEEPVEQSGKEETKKSEKIEEDKKEEPVELSKREVAKKSEKHEKSETDKTEEPVEQSGKEEAKKSEKRERDKTEEPVELSKRDVAKKSEKHEKSETDKAEEPVEQSGKEETKKSEKIEEDKKEEPEQSGKEEAKKSEKRERDKTEEPVELSKRDVAKKSEKHEKSETDKAEEPVEQSGKEETKKSEKIEEDKKEEPEQSGKEEAKKSEKRERDKTEEPVELSKRDVAKKSEKHEKSETDKAEEPVEQSGKEETKKSEKIEEDKKEEPVEQSGKEETKKSEKIEEDKKEEPEQSGKEETKKSETDKPEDSEDGGNAEDENRKKDSAPEDEDPELLSMPAVKRFSVSFAKHPTNGTQDDSSTVASSASRLCSWTESVEEHHVAQLLRFLSTDLSSGCRQLSLDHALAHHLHQCSYHLRLFRNWLISGQDPLECLHGFEGCSMVPSIYPLETLHNSLSLRQVNEFLTRVCESAGDTHTRTSRALSAMLGAHNQPDIPQRILTTSMSLKSRSDRPPWYSSGPSSTVSSAGPSSPTTADTSPRFSFSDKVSLTPQSSEETHSSQNASAQPLPAEVPLTPNNSPEEEPEPDKQPDDPEPAADGQEASCDTLEPVPEQGPACVALAELSLGRMEGYCLPGSLPVLLELRESSSEAGSSSQTPQSPEGPDEFFDTQESVELWTDSPENAPQPDTAQDPEPAQPVEQ